MGSGMGGHQKPFEGKNNEWLTPPEIIEKLGPFDVDPCSPIQRPWDTAKKHFTELDDGLSKGWDGLAWLNPPYGPHVGKWLSKLAESEHGGIALVFARTETEWCQKEVFPKASGIFFLAGRLHFHFVDGRRAPHNSGAPSIFIAYGNEALDRLRRLKDGHLVVLEWEEELKL
jgi:hypothetical protein